MSDEGTGMDRPRRAVPGDPLAGFGEALGRDEVLGLGRLAAAVVLAGALLGDDGEQDRDPADPRGFVRERPLSLDLPGDVPDL